MEHDQKKAIFVDYINWEGKRKLRQIIPLKLWWGHTEWHKDDQWLLKVWDQEKQAERDYGMSGIKGWYTSP